MMKLYSKLNGWDWADSMDFKNQHFSQKARKSIRRIRKTMARKVRNYYKELDRKEKLNLY